MTPYFKVGYSLIVSCLSSLVIYLLFKLFADMFSLLLGRQSQSDPIQPFTIIIFVTLAFLAIFDFGKTILEEEILMHKAIFRHSSTRRTITRF